MAAEYEEGERVLCFQGPVIYEAKVLAVEFRREPGSGGQYYYQVHYLGWNKNWDEWVSRQRVLKYTPENLRKQALTKEEAKRAEMAARASGAGDSTGGRTNKRRRTEGGINDDGYSNLLQFELPMSLRRVLVNDWRYVTSRKKSYPLPRKHTMDRVLEEFLEAEEERADTSDAAGVAVDVMRGVCDGLMSYFNVACGRILLYRQERTQYGELVRKNPTVNKATVYGAEHLLRLLVKLSDLIAPLQMEPDTLTSTRLTVRALVRYLAQNAATLFSPDVLDGVTAAGTAAARRLAE